MASAIILGLALIFIYYQKLIKLYRLQQNFINGFTHELKTPIASLRLYLDTFNKYNLEPEEQKKYINYMIQDTDRLHLNVNQILNLSKIEDGSFAPSFSKVNLEEFLKNFFERNPHYFEDVDINIKVESNFWINVDEKLFEMVLMNIVTNSINYSHSEVKTELSIHSEIQNKNVILYFKDNGIGIPKTEIKKIFRKMYQIGKSTKGSGLGLYIVQSIMKLHKGDVSATSEGIDKGATIRLKIPMVKE